MTKKAKKRITKARITSNKRIAADYFVMEIEAPRLGKGTLPGQFVGIKASAGATDPLVRIPLGVYDASSKGVKLLYKVVGKGTELLSAMKKGEEADVLGSLGNAFDLSPLTKKTTRAVIVAGGHGIAPLCYLAKTIIKKNIRADVFVGASTKKHVLCAGEMKKLGAKVWIATEDGTQGYKGYVTGLLKERLNKLNEDEKILVYACGPRPMLAAVARETKKMKIPTQVSVDAYMICGIGACLGCAVKTTGGYKMVCKDGPVFDAEEIDWKEACCHGTTS